MNANLKNNITNSPDDFVIEFEAEKTPVRLGKSDRYFYMDFNDTNFPARLQQGRSDISEFIQSKREEFGVDDISDIYSKERTVEEIEKAIMLSKEIDEFIKSKIDFIFGYDISKDVFGSASSVSVTRLGEYYFDSFLNAVLPLVEREYQVRIKATNERIRKYTDHKGLHPALKKI